MKFPEKLDSELVRCKTRADKIQARKNRWFQVFPGSDDSMRINICNERLKNSDIPYLDRVNKVLLERKFDNLIDTPEKLTSVLVPISLGLQRFIRENRYRSFDSYNSVSRYACNLQEKVIRGDISFELANDIGEICLGTIKTRLYCQAGCSVESRSIESIASLGQISNSAVEKYIAGLRELDEYVNKDGRRNIKPELPEELRKAGLVSEKNVRAVIAAASRDGEELSEIFGVTCKMDSYGFNIDIPGTVYSQIKPLYSKAA